MKQLTTYLPFALVGAAAIGLVYFLYYKPKQDAEEAANAAVQSELTSASNSLLVKVGGERISGSLSAQASKANWEKLKAKLTTP